MDTLAGPKKHSGEEDNPERICMIGEEIDNLGEPELK